MSYLDASLRRLPDSYNKDKCSNNYKLFDIISAEFDGIFTMFSDIQVNLDIDKAYGKTLDKLSSNLGQRRGQVNDSVLRTIVKAKIMSEFGTGTVNTLLDIINFILTDPNVKNQIKDMWNDPDYPEEAAFKIVSPVESVLGTGLTINQFVNLMLRVKGAGVKMLADFTGTFEFGDISEYDSEYDTGFADENQTVGGTLGAFYDPAEDTPLPI